MEHCDRACSASTLSCWVQDARRKSLELIADLDDEQLSGRKLATTNPLLWEIGHAAWFQEHWVLQHVGQQPPIRPEGDQLFDSIAIHHDVRWDLPVPSRDVMLRYVVEVRDRVLELLDRGPPSESLVYFVKLSVFHEDMHTEAFTYTRQTLGYPPPQLSGRARADAADAPGQFGSLGDATITGGTFLLGAPPDAGFVFDNEQWAHAVDIPPFAIARLAVTQGEFREFVNAGGYRRRDCWSREGWQWRSENQAEHPVYWRRAGKDQWLRRDFDTWLELEPRRPMIHVNWFEAEAYARWAGRRLPTEAEWELAAAGLQKHHYPWGAEPPSPQRAQLDWQNMGTAEVTAHPAGDSPLGCRQMIGNVWEWTATTLAPYPGFAAGPYKEYSTSCFGECKILRGGCWASRERLLRNSWRNFYRPDRRDVWAGFRTCADRQGPIRF